MNPISAFQWNALMFLCYAVLLSSPSLARYKRPVHGHSKDHHSAYYSPTEISTTGWSGTGANINVIYQRCNWTINPDAAKNIAGVVTIKFVTTQNFVSTLSFDLNKASFNNSNLIVRYHGATVTKSFPTTGNVNILNITLPVSIAINTIDSIEISYSGAPPAVSGQAEGYQKKTDASGNNYVYTLSESFEDKDWWPCKADMQDRIDSMDINVSVPNGFRVATNGKFIDSSTLSGGNRTFKYKLKYSIPSYLVALGIAKYKIIDKGTVNINGTNVPVWYFLFPRSSYTTITNYLDKSIAELTAFSNVWGDYPFKNEKHGFYEFGWGGGMEHQSFSAMGAGALTSWGTIAHELAHQWFGDKVTFATWNHLWLAEGFARYGEIMAAELVPALSQNPKTTRSGIRATAMNTTYRSYGAFVPNSSITSSDILWSSRYGTTVYERGAMVVSTLRALLGDEKFFQACRNYLNDPDLAYGSATTEDLSAHFSTVAGADLTEFFNDWVYGGGYPNYTIHFGYNPTTMRTNISVSSQTRTSAGSTSYFNTPIVLKISNASNSKDTTVVIYDKGGGNLAYAGNGIGATVTGGVIGYRLSFVPSSISFDPDLHTMATGTVSMLASLPVRILSFTNTQSDNSNKILLSLSVDSDNRGVVLERSANGKDFYSLGTMNVMPGHLSNKNYAFTDKTVVDEVCYYRAKIIDLDGTIRYSGLIKSTNNFASNDIVILPTVVSSTCSIVLPLSFAGSSNKIKILSVSGSIVKSISNVKGGNVTQLNLSDLHNGIYWIHVDNGKNVYSLKKIVIQH